MNPVARLAHILPIVLLSGCGVSITAGSHMPSPIDVGDGPTFAWNQGSDRVGGDPRLEGNQFFEESLHEAVAWHLALRGIREASASPTYLIHHHLTLAEHAYVEEVMNDAGVSRTETVSYEEGSVTVHIVDAATGGTVWLGWAQADVEPALHGPEEMRRWVYDLVGSMFRKWPVPQNVGG
jgi:hypothetical protein